MSGWFKVQTGDDEWAIDNPDGSLLVGGFDEETADLILALQEEIEQMKDAASQIADILQWVLNTSDTPPGGRIVMDDTEREWIQHTLKALEAHAMDALTPMDALCSEAFEVITILLRERDLVVTEGRAYHAGDVVLLRLGTNDGDAFRVARMALNDLENKTGVVFVLLAGDVEVVEPNTQES